MAFGVFNTTSRTGRRPLSNSQRLCSLPPPPLLRCARGWPDEHAPQSINMVTKRSPSGTYDLYITRFLDEAGGTLLSAMLHGVDGAYEPGAADYWEKLRQTFGAEQTVA